MNKRYFIFLHSSVLYRFFPVALLSAFLIIGCIAGTVSANTVSEVEGVSEYLGSVSSAATFWAVLFDTAMYHAAVFAAGFCVFGFVLIPLILGVRAYMLAFATALVIRSYGTSGILPSFLLFGAKSLILIPCLLFIAMQSFYASLRLTSSAFSVSSGIRPYDGVFTARSVACFLILTILSLAIYFLSPSVTSYIQNII